MTMTMDQQHRHVGGLPFDHMPYGASSPHFTNPWGSATSGPSTSHLFPNSLGPSNVGFDSFKQQQSRMPGTISLPYSSVPAPATSIGAPNNYVTGAYNQPELLGLSHDLMNQPRPSIENYSTAPTSNAYAPTSSPYVSYGNLQRPQDEGRRLSQQSSSSGAPSQASFSDALDAGHGMVAMSQDLTTPRNIYGPKSDRDSVESYGFPSSHSSHSSVSSSSTYPQSSYAGSYVDSVSDYSSASELDSGNARTLPRPSGLLGANLPPAPQSMMGQFNSKVSSSTQKKHKCKICDKRFTRPSSLQTHMYSHTGEKPYACEVEGCGRHFSVVSNLRRHRKVHKGDSVSDHESPESSWTSEK